MKTRKLSAEALVLLGAFGASFAACSAQSSGSPPRGTAGSGNTGNTGNVGTGNTGNVGTGNTGNVGTGNTGNVGTGNTGNVGTGNTGNVGTGNTGNVGTGNTGNTTGVAGATMTSTGGATGAMSCGTLLANAADAKCCVATGTVTNFAIDDLEDQDNTILPVENRQGYWYSYKDTVAATTLMPSAAPFTVTKGGHACSLVPAPPACAGTAGGMVASAGVSGMVAAATTAIPAYAGMGFDFNNHFMKSCPYGGSAYKGITFWARGTPFKASVKIPATTGATALSVGSCAAMCEDHFSQQVAPPPDTTTWAQITITFTDATKFKQAGWGTPATFDASSILALQFQIDGTTTQTAAVAYGFAVDDIAFF
jgi:hypothetical protein